MDTFKFTTNSLTHEVVGLKGEREYYVTGHISTDEVDRAGEVVTREAMKSMVEQIKSGNVKLDIEHSTFIGENDVPVGKIIDAGMDDKGVWVKCVLNKAHSRFNEYWKSIKEGFLDAFSIAYKTLETTKEVIEGATVTMLKTLELLNVAITGNPICRGATMTESFYKSLKHMEENNMTEENVEEPIAKPAVEEPVVEEPVVEEKVEEVVEEPVVEEKVEDKDPNPLDAIKGMQKEIASLKAEIEGLQKTLKKPVLKAINNTDIADVKSEVVYKSPLQTIR